MAIAATRRRSTECSARRVAVTSHCGLSWLTPSLFPIAVLHPTGLDEIGACVVRVGVEGFKEKEPAFTFGVPKANPHTAASLSVTHRHHRMPQAVTKSY